MVRAFLAPRNDTQEPVAASTRVFRAQRKLPPFVFLALALVRGVPSAPMRLRLSSSWLALPLFVAALVACDDKKPDAAAPKPSATPAALAAPSPPPKKKDVVCPKDAAITFADAKFEAVVRVQAAKPEGPLTRADLGKAKTLNLTEAKLDELDPCIFPLFTSVKGLYLPPGKIEDLSPLKTLTTLESLRLAATQVKDLSPLSGLSKLDRLDIGRTPVKDLKPLEGLVNITELQIDETEVTDLSPLSKLTKLEMIQMKRTRVADLSPLKELKSLKQLHISGSAVSGQPVMLGIAGLKVHDD
jgi:internalin A